jgi:hypothetical protein
VPRLVTVQIVHNQASTVPTPVYSRAVTVLTAVGNISAYPVHDDGEIELAIERHSLKYKYLNKYVSK